MKWDPTEPSNWRATSDLVDWMAQRGRIGIGGIDPPPDPRDPPAGARRMWSCPRSAGNFDISAMIARAPGLEGIVGLDLAKEVSTRQSYRWDEGLWAWPGSSARPIRAKPFRVVALDYGAKRNILRSLAQSGAEVTVLPATATAEGRAGPQPRGVFLSNGPGDPAATGEYAVPMIRAFWRATCPDLRVALATRCLHWPLAPRPSR